MDIEVILPSFTANDMDKRHTHALPGKFPVIYLPHGYANDCQVWLRYTSIERYAEEHRIAVVTFSCHNKAYHNAPLASGKKLPDLFMCIGEHDFLHERVTRYNETFMPKWHGSRYRFDDLPDYEHEFAICDKEVLAFIEWIKRDDAFAAMGKNKV